MLIALVDSIFACSTSDKSAGSLRVQRCRSSAVVPAHQGKCRGKYSCGTRTSSVSDRRVSSTDTHPHIYIPTFMHFVLIMQRRKCVCVSPVLQGVTGAGAGGGKEVRGGMHVPLCNDLTCNPPTRIVKRRETILVEGEKFIAQTGLRQFIIPLLLEQNIHLWKR